MRFRVRKAAHVLERFGLALAGATSGMFVGAYVGSEIPPLAALGFLLAMMVAGTVGFYLGIDGPQLHFDEQDDRIDIAEFFSSVGTFFATIAAFVSVAVIVTGESPHSAWSWPVLICWIAGVAMQIVGGAKARLRR